MLLCWLSYFCTWTCIWWIPREIKGTSFKTCCWWSLQEGCWTRASGVLSPLCISAKSLLCQILSTFSGLYFHSLTGIKHKLQIIRWVFPTLLTSQACHMITGLLIHRKNTKILKHVSNTISLIKKCCILNLVVMTDWCRAVSEGPQVHKIWNGKQCYPWVWRWKIGIQRLLRPAHCFLECSGTHLFDCNICSNQHARKKHFVWHDDIYLLNIRMTCW